uniref:Ovule protein n=1 Tax=Haemonchus placei TaxID=6290 RepID=A0A0N4WES1_HAEPC
LRRTLVPFTNIVELDATDIIPSVIVFFLRVHVNIVIFIASHIIWFTSKPTPICAVFTAQPLPLVSIYVITHQSNPD